MKALLAAIAALVLVSTSTAHANLCKGAGGRPTLDLTNDIAYYHALFKDSSMWGDETWNQIILECNRLRDGKGSEVVAVTGSGYVDPKGTLSSKNLPPKVIRGFYRFFGDVLLQQKYVYVLSKESGVWKMIIPYSAIINDLVPGRVDYLIGPREIDRSNGMLKPLDSRNRGNAWNVYDGSQVKVTATGYALQPGARPIAETLCTTTTFFPGDAGKYQGENDANAYKRDAENKFISLGKLQYAYKKSDDFVYEGCRVDKDQVLYWVPDPSKPVLKKTTAHDQILDNFVRAAESYWTIPGVFELQLLLKGRNEANFPKSTLDLLRDDDRLTANFATKFPPYGFNQMYKSNVVQFNNFSTMTTDDTYHHEVGHAFGLDDEYANANEDTNDKSCENPTYVAMSRPYIMCQVLSATEGNEMRTIYPYIAVSRYITKQSECDSDSDCGAGKYCDAGVDLTKNQCIALKSDGSACALVGGDHQCKSTHCGVGRCFTPSSVAMGGTCFVDAACKVGKCSSIDGTKGTCVCRDDGDCGSGSYCDAGVDFTKNQCIALKSDGSACALIGGDHQCKSTHCGFGHCFTPGSVAAGGTCYTDTACKGGKCTSIDGAKGTCVCKDDSDCGTGMWCDAGLDFKKNACRAKLNAGASCGDALSLGNDHKCKSGKCSGFPKYECK